MDERLGPALLFVESGALEVLSLDVFDTLLFRRVPEPRDAFLLLGAQLLEAGLLEAGTTPELFAWARAQAEWRARSHGDGEVLLSEIYAELPGPLVRCDLPELIRAELANEHALLEVDQGVRSLLERARKLKLRTCLVSDTYFTEPELRGLLAGRGLPVPELLFLSSSHRRAKGSGLFAEVLAALGCAPSRILHVGDNLDADLAAARAQGLHALHLPRLLPELHQVLERERQGPLLDAREGDFALTALRGRMAVRESPVEPLAFRYGASILGPPLAAFAGWVVERCAALGQGEIFCLQREGELLASLINAQAVRAQSPLRARTLWASRDVAVRAAIFSASEEELRPLLQRRGATASGACESLGIDLGELPPGLLLADEPRVGEALLQRIAASPSLREQIVEKSAQLRERFQRYLHRELGGSRRVLLCDLGWGLTIQQKLIKLLPETALRGLYLMTHSQVREPFLAGLECESFLAQLGFPERESRWILRTPEILEQACQSEQGSLLDLSAAAEPVLGVPQKSAQQRAQVQAMQDGMRAFAEQWGLYQRGDHRSAPKALRAQLLRILFRAVVWPTRAEAALLGSFCHDENFGSTRSEPLVREGFDELSAGELLQLPMSQLYWPFGAAALGSDRLAAACAALAEGLPSSPREPGRSTRVELFVDSGQGFHEGEKSQAQLTEADGVCTVRLSCPVRGGALRAVRIDPSSQPGVLRLLKLGVQIWRDQAQGAPELFELRSIDDLLRLCSSRSLVALRGPLLFASSDDPQLVFAALREGVSRVSIELTVGLVALSVEELRELRPARLGLQGLLGRLKRKLFGVRKLFGLRRLLRRKPGQAGR